MEFNKRSTAFLLASTLALGAASCKTPQTNGNRQGAIGATSKPAKWVAQYRSPASLNYSGVNLSVFFYSGISVVSQSVVFVCGDTPNPKGGDERAGVILRTTDGGQHWTDTPIDLPGILIPTLNSIHFISPDVGWAVGVDSGEDGVVLKTTDAGSSWAVTRLTQKQTPIAVFFTDADSGWIGGSTPLLGEEESIGGPSAILATTDGGHTWHPQYNVPLSILRIFFVDKMSGWASGTKGVIYNTTDGGRTWDKQRTEIEAGDGPIDFAGDGVKQFAIRGLQFIDKDHGFAAAGATEQQAGRMLVTSNGGATWHRQWMVTGAAVRDVFFLSPNEGWALTDQGPYVNHTVDGGRSWLSEPKVFEQDVALSRVAGANASHVWAVGGGAIFFRVSE
ncbi:MAG TPA: YCF48-related protein [Blastocatellia bacterium]|nr:YCF48-related protein [Blastocatellia bacterium]